jgi:parallel beta-helix repeat protein
MIFAAVGFCVLGVGQARADHVYCGQTITQDTKLDSDLIDCPGDGIVIGADTITLDLNGHTIDGDGACCDLLSVGVQNGTLFSPTTGHDNVTIKGGTIREFYNGISVFGTSANVLRSLSVSENADAGVLLHNSDHGVIEHSNLSTNSRGIHLRGSGENLIRRNAMSANGLGLSVIQTTGDNVIEHNEIFGNGGGMAFALSSGTNRVVNNRLSGNGIVFLRAAGFDVEGNSISGSSPFAALLLIESHDNRIERNSLSQNDQGIELQIASRNNRIAGNLVVNSARSGISLGRTHNDGNEFIHNLLFRNGEDGIRIRAENLGNVVRENVTNGNGDDGIDVGSPTTTLTRNVANSNGDLGIEAVPGVIDGGGNRATANGNPLQCLYVAC